MYTIINDPVFDPNLPKLEISIGINGFEPHNDNVPAGYLAHNLDRTDLLLVSVVIFLELKISIIKTSTTIRLYRGI